jgi:hypothetical protein
MVAIETYSDIESRVRAALQIYQYLAMVEHQTRAGEVSGNYTKQLFHTDHVNKARGV